MSLMCAARLPSHHPLLSPRDVLSIIFFLVGFTTLREVRRSQSRAD